MKFLNCANSFYLTQKGQQMKSLCQKIDTWAKRHDSYLNFVIGLMVGGILVFSAMAMTEKSRHDKEMVKRGYALYDCDPKSGKTFVQYFRLMDIE